MIAAEILMLVLPTVLLGITIGLYVVDSRRTKEALTDADIPPHPPLPYYRLSLILSTSGAAAAVFGLTMLRVNAVVVVLVVANVGVVAGQLMQWLRSRKP